MMMIMTMMVKIDDYSDNSDNDGDDEILGATIGTFFEST